MLQEDKAREEQRRGKLSLMKRLQPTEPHLAPSGEESGGGKAEALASDEEAPNHSTISRHVSQGE